MTAAAAPPRPRGLGAGIAWRWRHDPKLELWLAWVTMVVFYTLFGVVFVLLARVMPPPKPYWDAPRVARWFRDNHSGLLIGFGIIFAVTGVSMAMNALIAYSMRRMSVSPAFAYAYLAIYSLSAVPGMLLTSIALYVGAMRPERDPQALHWLYDFAILSFDGTMGVFLIGTLVWMIAILIDRNRVFPRWFGYLNFCNAVTEFVIASAWILKRGPFSWNGSLAFWLDTAVFVAYTMAFITLLRGMIVREDFGDGPLPGDPDALARRLVGLAPEAPGGRTAAAGIA